MGNIQNDITILKGNLRYKGASERLISLPVEFVGDRKQLIDADRTRNVNAAEQTEVERQASTTFRPSCKFVLLMKNTISGQTGYSPFKNNLYYVNESYYQQLSFQPNFDGYWGGYPEYKEFDLTNKFKGDVKQQLNQASELILDICEI